MTPLAPIVQGFFTERLTQRCSSPNTVIAYRDAFCLLLRFAAEVTGKAPSQLDLADLDHVLISAFLDHLEVDRSCSVATRNLRRSTVRSLYSYAALHCPEQSLLIQRVLAIPPKREEKRIVSYLTRCEVAALLKTPDRRTYLGRRDHALLAVAIQTGLRVSELTGLTCADLELGVGANLYCQGKGRRDRRTPLTSSTAWLLRTWMRERNGKAGDALFPSLYGGRLSTDAVSDLLAKYVALARVTCPSLRRKRVTPHVLRHTCAMALLQAGVDTSVIALFLGHAGTQSTGVYLHADLSMKERALERTAPPGTPGRGRFRPSDPLLAFLEAL